MPTNAQTADLFAGQDAAPYVPYAANFYGKPGCIYVAHTDEHPGIYRIGLTARSRPEDRIEQLQRQSGKQWQLTWWKYTKDCGRAKAQIFKALNAYKRPSQDGARFVLELAEIKDVVRAACESPRQTPDTPKLHSPRYIFTIFQSKTDGHWYWFLKDNEKGIAIARGNPQASQQDCQRVIAQLSQHSATAEIWDATNGVAV